MLEIGVSVKYLLGGDQKKKKVVRCIITFLKMFTALNTWDLADITYMDYDSQQARI